MESESAPELKFDASALDRLACPACFGVLRADAQYVLCVSCGRIYPIIDGIPVLIVERAEIAGSSKAPKH